MPRILVIRLSSIGDIVLTTPVIRCLKKQIKDAEIHFLTKQSYSDVLANSPYIDNTYYWQDNSAEIIRQLKSNHYDYIIDLHKNLRTWKIKSSLRVKSYTFNKLNVEKWLLVNFKVNKLPHKHIVDRYFDAIQPLGVVNDGEGLDFFINPLDEIDVATYLPEHFQTGYSALVIGARHATKQLPLSKLEEVCQQVTHPLVVLGGAEDRETGAVLEKQFQNKVFNACGKTSIGQSASLIRQSRAVITHDTGLMHIAAALRKKIISVWGNTVPEFGMYPYLPKGSTPFSIVEIKNLYCRPCSKIGYNKCPKKHFRCMMEINPHTIADLESKYYDLP